MSYPKTWDEVPLIDLCLEPFANGITLTQQSMGHGAKLVNIVDLYENHIIDIHTLGRADASKQQLKKSELKKGDIVFVRSSVKREGAAMCAYFPGDKEPVVFGCFNIRFRPKPELVDSKFITLFLRSSEGRSRLLNVCQTATITNINQDNLGLVSVPLPPLAEQKRIAAIAQKADRLRRTRRYALQLGDTYLQSVFLEMFGDPSTNPKGWKIKSLDEAIIDAKNGISRRRKTAENAGTIVLRIRDVGAGSIDYSEPNRISLSKDEAQAYNINAGDLLLVRVNGNPELVGRAAIFQERNEPIAFSDHIIRVRLNYAVVNPMYVAHLLNSPYGRTKVRKCVITTAGQFTINRSGISSIFIPFPPLPLQEKFAQIVQKFERFRTQQREAERQAEHLFQTLLHRAFRGELTPQDSNDEPASVLLEEIRAEQAQAEAETKAVTQAIGDAAEYLGTEAKQQDTEPIQLKLPGIE